MVLIYNNLQENLRRYLENLNIKEEVLKKGGWMYFLKRREGINRVRKIFVKRRRENER